MVPSYSLPRARSAFQGAAAGPSLLTSALLGVCAVRQASTARAGAARTCHRRRSMPVPRRVLQKAHFAQSPHALSRRALGCRPSATVPLIQTRCAALAGESCEGRLLRSAALPGPRGLGKQAVRPLQESEALRGESRVRAEVLYLHRYISERGATNRVAAARPFSMLLRTPSTCYGVTKVGANQGYTVSALLIPHRTRIEDAALASEISRSALFSPPDLRSTEHRLEGVSLSEPARGPFRLRRARLKQLGGPKPLRPGPQSKGTRLEAPAIAPCPSK